MRYPCPCCGYFTLDAEPVGTFEVCPVCYWEDDDVQAADPAYEGGAIKKAFVKEVRKPLPEESAAYPKHAAKTC